MRLKRIHKNLIAERLNLFLYDSRTLALRITRIVTSLVTFIGLFLLIYAYGYDIRAKNLALLLRGTDVVFTIFVISYLTRLLYAFRRWDFLKDTFVEGTFMGLIILNSLINLFFNNFLLVSLYNWLGGPSYYLFYEQIIALLLFVVFMLELGRIGASLGSIKINPSFAFIMSFIIIIAIGTGLLMLPAMTTPPGSMPVIDALFTAVSATCVTGLIVVDTATYFTFRGQVVILLLIQIGGLGIVTFATFFASFLKSGAGFKQRDLVPDYLDTETVSSARQLLRQIVFLTFFIEFISAVLIYFTWSGVMFDSVGEKIFYSVFHAISAFCNAGFSTFTGNLYEPGISRAYLLHVVIAVTFIFGSLGFTTVKDIFSPQRMRDRLAHPWKEWKPSTKISVNVAAFLLILGMVGYYFLEKDNTLSALNLSEAFITSFFQSATTRTAGFNSVDFSALAPPTLILMMFLMFIGGASGSTAGGIKTSTFYVIIASVIATGQGKSKLFISNRYIPTEVIYKSLSIFFYAIAVILIGVFCLSITEPETNILDLTFEQVSAFGTVGLSTGITATLSAAGKIVILISMFLGRVGILTFAVALSKRKALEDFKLPSYNMMVG